MNTDTANGTPTLSNPSTPVTLDAGANPATGNAGNGDAYAEAYDNTATERAALHADELLPINLDIDVTVTTALATAAQLVTIHTDIVEMIPAVIAARFARLKEYGQALAYAQGIFLTASQPDPELPTMHDRAVKIRLLLATDALVLAQRGLVDQRIIDQLKGPVGYLNTTSDLNVLITLHRRNGSKLSAASSIKPADLDEAQQAYEALMAGVVARAEQPTTVEGATDQRLRAYTLVLNAYDQVRRAVTFVRWDQEDMEKYAPSLFVSHGSHAKKKDLVPVPPAPPTTTVTTTAAEPSPVNHNMPGGSPFTHN